MRNFIFILALAAAPVPTATMTEFYVDPDFAGPVQDGSAANPWTRLDGYPTGAVWTAINNALATGDVTVYFSARAAASETNQISYVAVDLARTNKSAFRLTVDGMSRYNTNDENPSWLVYNGPCKCEVR